MIQALTSTFRNSPRRHTAPAVRLLNSQLPVTNQFGDHRVWRSLLAVISLPVILCSCKALFPQEANMNIEPQTGQLIFESLGGYSEAAIDDKLTTAVNRFFGLGTDESATPTLNTGYRCYYELPQDKTKAFIWAVDSNDIRSEGMSYGMMIAVQMDLKTQFDALWNFATTYMQYQANSTIQAWCYYFRWQLTNLNVNNPNNWTWTTGQTVTPAPDGDEYFAMALYLADRRWGSNGAINYKAEADAISNALLNNQTSDIYHPIIHPEYNLICFCPIGTAFSFTNPSYHLPAFYDCFAAWGPADNAERWRQVASASREFLVNSAHSETGLHPDYANYYGQPIKDTSGNPGNGLSGDEGHDNFRYDAWRVVMNMAMDYAWWGKDERLKAQIEKYHNFFSAFKDTNNVKYSLFSLDGKNPSGYPSSGLTATLAVGALASEHPDVEFWVKALWTIRQESGEWRYYHECLYLLGLLNLAGKYRTGSNNST